MNEKFKFYTPVTILLFCFTVVISHDRKQDDDNHFVAKENNRPVENSSDVSQTQQKTKQNMGKLALKNGLFAVIGDHYNIDKELLLIPTIAFMLFVSYAGRCYAVYTNEHSYPIKTFVVANLIAGGVNGLIMSTGTALISVPFDSCITLLTPKIGFFSNGLNIILLKYKAFFNDNVSKQFRYFLEFFKKQNSYSLKYFLLKFTRGVVYIGQFVAQSIVGSILGRYFTFK